MRPLLEYLPEARRFLRKVGVSSGGTYLTAPLGCWQFDLVPWSPGDGTVRWACTAHSSQIRRACNGDTITEAVQECLHALDVAEEELKVQFAELRGLPRKV